MGYRAKIGLKGSLVFVKRNDGSASIDEKADVQFKHEVVKLNASRRLSAENRLQHLGIATEKEIKQGITRTVAQPYFGDNLFV